MIEVKRLKSGISVKGHANYAPHGQDIVCSAVSTLVQTLIQSVEELTTDKITYDMSPGTASIKFYSLSDQAKTLLDSFFIGIESISNAYPAYVRVITS